MNTQEIKRGEYNAYYPISELKMATVNRDTVTKHAENFKSKLKSPTSMEKDQGRQG